MTIHNRKIFRAPSTIALKLYTHKEINVLMIQDTVGKMVAGVVTIGSIRIKKRFCDGAFMSIEIDDRERG